MRLAVLFHVFQLTIRHRTLFLLVSSFELMSNRQN
jgi:hypothetical protein